ncbi:transposase [Streptomyces sp. SID3343]|uniref:transposase n=1 Tax=Streptomyces sp. SID3343 TaxID=2690260 RepID=UPI0031F88074
MDTCRIGVFAAYASRRGRALVDRRLYLPKSWTGERNRCDAARIPADRAFATKPEIARVVIARTLAAGMPVGWVAADEAFGHDFRFRRFCEEHHVACRGGPEITARHLDGRGRIDPLIGHAPAEAWIRMSWGDGAKDPRTYDYCKRARGSRRSLTSTTRNSGLGVGSRPDEA